MARTLHINKSGKAISVLQMSCICILQNKNASFFEQIIDKPCYVAVQPAHVTMLARKKLDLDNNAEHLMEQH